MLLVKAAVLRVGLALLREKDVVDIVVVGTRQFQIPIDQAAVHLLPLFGVHTVRQLHAYLAKLLLVVLRTVLALQPTPLGVLLHRQQQLTGRHGFNQVVADFSAEGVIHNMFLLALGNHHHRQLRPALLDELQRVDAAQAGHLLVEEHQIGHHRLQLVERVASALHGHHAIALLLEVQYMGFQQVDFIIGPKDGDIHSLYIVRFNRYRLYNAGKGFFVYLGQESMPM